MLLGVLVGAQAGVAIGFVVGVPLLLAALAVGLFVQIRFFQLAAPALVLERTGVFASLRRAGRLSRGQFWRIFGILLLTALVIGVVGQVVAVPLAVVGAARPDRLPRDGGGAAAGAVVLPLPDPGRRASPRRSPPRSPRCSTSTSGSARRVSTWS